MKEREINKLIITGSTYLYPQHIYQQLCILQKYIPIKVHGTKPSIKGYEDFYTYENHLRYIPLLQWFKDLYTYWIYDKDWNIGSVIYLYPKQIEALPQSYINDSLIVFYKQRTINTFIKEGFELAKIYDNENIYTNNDILKNLKNERNDIRGFKTYDFLIENNTNSVSYLFNQIEKYLAKYEPNSKMNIQNESSKS